MFRDQLDIQKFFEQGFVETEIDKEFADALLLSIKSEIWIKLKPESSLTSEEFGRNYNNRYIAAQSMLQPLNLKPSYKEYQDAFCEWARDIISNYGASNRFLTSAFCGVKGYDMDMHSDVGDRSTFTVILYLGHDLPEEDSGGDLNVFKVNVNNPHNDYHLTTSIRPDHGKMVVLNNLDPTIYHSVSPVNSRGRRYQILSSFGINELPDWEIPFPGKTELSGLLLNDKNPITMGDHEKAMKIIMENLK